MSVRNIPKNFVHVTGRHASQKSEGNADFESLLEAEHMLLLDHDEQVKAYGVQPVNIPVPGVPRGYVPDTLVEFYPDEDGVIAAPELREVKSMLDLQVNAAKYALKFEQARRYCEQRGWLFRIITDKEIRTPRLANVKFLRAYETQQHSPEMMDEVLKRMVQLGHTDSAAVLNSLTTDLDEQLRWMPVLWHLVAKRRIVIDWDREFTPVVPLWPVGGW